MKKSKSIKMKLAGREWARQFYTAVVKSLSKTITEPITNSDTSYKRKYSLNDSNGLIEKALNLKKGNRFDLTSAKKELAETSPQREIEVHLYRAQGHGQKPRTCEIVDNAEGLSPDDLEQAFEYLAGDKSVVSKNRPGRSLFGRGVSDVLLGHQPSYFASYHDGVLSKAEFSFNLEKDDAPEITIKTIENPSIAELKKYRLTQKENGSCVNFVLHNDCRIPEEGTLVQILSQFYMLRLINADPNVSIKLYTYRSGRKVSEEVLDYDFPIGNVIDKFKFVMSDPVPGKHLPDLIIEGIICKADDKSGLPGKEAGDLRANGLLMVDDKDAVLDLSFLPQYENAPYLSGLFGIVRITNIRNVLEWFLKTGMDSPLTVTRDGFEQRNDFTKHLFSELAKQLDPIYKKEEERYKKAYSSNFSAKTQEKINEALKELNKFLKEIGDGTGKDGEPSMMMPTGIIQFVPQKTSLIIGKEHIVRLYLKKEYAKPKTNIIFDSNNPKIEVKPLSHAIEEGKKVDDHIIFSISIKCDNLHEKGTVTALAEGKDGLLETSLEISDVTSGILIVAPEYMEFRPSESRGQPIRENNLALYINPKTIPVGRKIDVRLEKTHGTIGIRVKDKIVSSASFVFDKSCILQDHNVGRLLIPWKGSGWGQSSRVIAETKLPDGTLKRAEGRILIEQPEEKGGIIRKVVYGPLEDQRCSDLVDGTIYINSKHNLNKIVFGIDQHDYSQRIEKDRTAQYKFSHLIVEQSVFRLAEEYCRDSKLILGEEAPVTNLREFVDKKTHELAPKITKVLLT